MKEVLLRQLVEKRLERRWEAFAADHPQLAAAIDRTRLVEVTVERIADDPAYRLAMEAAGRDEAILAAALRVVDAAEAWVDRALGL